MCHCQKMVYDGMWMYVRYCHSSNDGNPCDGYMIFEGSCEISRW